MRYVHIFYAKFLKSRLCELFWVSSKKQSIRFLNEGLMDIIFTNCLEYKDEFLYEALARVIRKMLKMSRKGIREAKQKLYELNGMQIFEKLLAIKQRQAIIMNSPIF